MLLERLILSNAVNVSKKRRSFFCNAKKGRPRIGVMHHCYVLHSIRFIFVSMFKNVLGYALKFNVLELKHNYI